MLRRIRASGTFVWRMSSNSTPPYTPPSPSKPPRVNTKSHSSEPDLTNLVTLRIVRTSSSFLFPSPLGKFLCFAFVWLRTKPKKRLNLKWLRKPCFCCFWYVANVCDSSMVVCSLCLYHVSIIVSIVVSLDHTSFIVVGSSHELLVSFHTCLLCNNIFFISVKSISVQRAQDLLDFRHWGITERYICTKFLVLVCSRAWHTKYESAVGERQVKVKSIYSLISFTFILLCSWYGLGSDCRQTINQELDAVC